MPNKYDFLMFYESGLELDTSVLFLFPLETVFSTWMSNILCIIWAEALNVFFGCVYFATSLYMIRFFMVGKERERNVQSALLWLPLFVMKYEGGWCQSSL